MEKVIKAYKKKSGFGEATEKELKQLTDLGNGKLPDDVIAFFKEAMPQKDIELGDYVLYPITRMIEENKDYIPGAYLYPLGLITIASTLDGDAICIDTISPEGRVYLCSHSLIEEDRISFYKNGIGMVRLDRNYENVIKCSFPIGNDFKDFMNWIKTGKRGSINVINYVIERYN